MKTNINLNNNYYRFNKLVTISIPIFSIIITSTALARPTGGIGAVRGENGAAGGGFIEGDNGSVGCIGVVTTDKGAGGCRGNYHNQETGANRTDNSRWNYSEGTFQNNRSGTGTRSDGSTFNRNINGNYDSNNQTGQRNVIRSGTTQNSTQYNYQKNTTYSEGELCRTVTGDFGEYHYQNNGQWACY